jgi:hypothetical protein
MKKISTPTKLGLGVLALILLGEFYLFTELGEMCIHLVFFISFYSLFRTVRCLLKQEPQEPKNLKKPLSFGVVAFVGLIYVMSFNLTLGRPFPSEEARTSLFSYFKD